MRKVSPAVIAAVLFTVLALAPAVEAGVVATPNAYATIPAPGGLGLNTFIRDLNNPRTGQLLIHALELTALPAGSQVTGMTYRMFAGGTSFPPADATWADYTIRVGEGGPLPGSTTFANNFVGVPTIVKTGPLTFTTGSFPVGGSPNPWGTDIVFTTPFIYNSGNLCIEVRHTGSNITNAATHFLEAVATTDPNYNTRVWSATATGATATTGAVATYTVTRLQVIPSPVELLSVGVE